jgi:uncharacterized MnhB-related membrane protein
MTPKIKAILMTTIVMLIIVATIMLLISFPDVACTILISGSFVALALSIYSLLHKKYVDEEIDEEED